jgi:uncharacterized protein YecA (UPF0149 family)
MKSDPYIELINFGNKEVKHHLAVMKHYENDMTKKQLEAIVQPIRTEPKFNRNEPCHCGSGKKYKKCCIK